MALSPTALSALKKALAPNQIITNPVELLTYEVDASQDRGMPDAVVFPASTEDVVRLVEWANQHSVPLIGRGAGTCLSGGPVAEHGGVVVTFSRMKRILDFDISGRSVVVEPGVVNLTLDEYVKAQGLYYPPDPASGRTATIGGNIAENAGGPHCFKYGVTSNYITGLEVVLADGRRLRLGGKAFDTPEYDLIGLFTGNEGTLGLITEATARLIRAVPAVKTMLASFGTLEEAGNAVSAVIAAGLVPATLEMMDQACMRTIEAFAHAGLPVDDAAGMIIETDGYPDSVSPQMDEVAAILRRFNAKEMRIARTAAERDQIWYGRKSAAGTFARVAPAHVTMDGTVPRSQLAPTITAINRIARDLGLSMVFLAHAGDGNLHPNTFYDPAIGGMIERTHQAWDRIMEVCVANGGSITGEHGVGSEKRKYMPLMFSPDELSVFEEIRDTFDPKRLLNPGKIYSVSAGSEAQGAGAATAQPADPWALPDASQFARQFTPTGAEEASAMFRHWQATERPICVRIQGGGTKSPLGELSDVTVTTAGLRGIVALAPDDLYVTAGAGIPLAELQEQVARTGMWVPLATPWSASTVGGIVATAFNSPLRMRYGGVRDNVLAMTVVLPDGRIIRAGRPVVKNVAGYDLPKLFVGSYGTLGLITDVTLKLAALPRERATLVVPMDDLAGAMACGSRLLQICLTASSLLFCRTSDLPGAVGDSGARYALVYTAEGIAQDVEAELAQVQSTLEAQGVQGALVVDGPPGADLWARWMGGSTLFDTVLRAGVAPKDMPAFMTRLISAVGKAPLVADLASGLTYLRGAEAGPVREIARSLGGYTVVLSSPDGRPDRWGPVPAGTDLVRQLKRRWDPKGILNPGSYLL